MVSMIANAVRQIGEFLWSHGMVILFTVLFIGVFQYFLAYIPLFSWLPSYIQVAFDLLLGVTIWFKIRTYFSQG